MFLLFETNKLKTRKATEFDAEFLAEIESNEQVQEHTGGVKVTFENTLNKIKGNPESLCRFYIIEIKETGVSIGILGIVPNSHLPTDEIVISLLPAYWGKGYGPEILSKVKERWLGSKKLDRMHVTVSPYNNKSISMLKKEGFTFVEEYHDRRRSVHHIYEFKKQDSPKT